TVKPQQTRTNENRWRRRDAHPPAVFKLTAWVRLPKPGRLACCRGRLGTGERASNGQGQLPPRPHPNSSFVHVLRREVSHMPEQRQIGEKYWGVCWSSNSQAGHRTAPHRACRSDCSGPSPRLPCAPRSPRSRPSTRHHQRQIIDEAACETHLILPTVLDGRRPPGCL